MDVMSQRIAVTGLVLLTLIAAGGAVYLVAIGRDVPPPMVAMGSAAVGALAALITPITRAEYRRTDEPPTRLSVQ